MRPKLDRSVRDLYERWVADYRRFARMRGFESFNDWPYHRRGFIECWAQPGFHRFWQVWNPGIAYFVYRVYIALGGRRRYAGPVLAAFLFCGLAHTVVVAPFLGAWSFSVVGAFGVFGVLTLVSRRLEPLLKQERWPWPINVLLNAGLVLLGFDLGFRLDRLL